MYQSLPKHVQILEVGPRDGFQNVKDFIPTEDKIAIIESLIEAGIKDIEVSSFVSPKAIPQLADAATVCKTILNKYGDAVRTSALVPNLKGAQGAWEAGIREVVCVISVSEAHNKANVNRTHEESLQELSQMLKALPEMRVRVDFATAFACPFAGWVAQEEVLRLAAAVTGMGIQSIALCDTIGVATPDRVYETSAAMKRAFPHVNYSLHLHDTRGMGLVNTIAGLQAGITRFETSIGGLGGCPFAPGAAGNTATEDVVNMFNDMNIQTGIDLERLLRTTALVGAKVNAPQTGHMAKAKLYDCLAVR